MQLPADLARRYERIRVLGEGGMGAVLLCRDHELDRLVAIKLVKGQLSEGLRARFHREAAAMARLEHPHLIRLYEYGEAGDGPYMVMEYVEGSPLVFLPDELDPMVPLFQIAEALEAMHACGLLHRDLKPHNALWTRQGRAVLLDLGLVYDPKATMLTRQGMVVGTLGYLAPEAMRLDPWTPACDWYGWGATAYALYEERVPVTGEDLERFLAGGDWPEVQFSALDPGDPEAILIATCLDPDPAARPASRQQLAELLGRVPGVPGEGAGPGRLSRRRTQLGLRLAGKVTPLDGGREGPVGAPDPPPAAPVAEGRGPRAVRPLVPWMAALAALALVAALAWRAAEPAPPGGLVSIEPTSQGLPRWRAPDGSHRVLVPDLGAAGLRVDETEVTVARYAAHLDAAPLPTPFEWERQRAHPARPVVFLTVEEAERFCLAVGGRLPTPSEWRYLATLGEDLRWPWGEEALSHAHANLDLAGDRRLAPWFEHLAPVASYPRGTSLLGLADLVGNVAEWAVEGLPGGGRVASLHGGSWADRPGAVDLRAAGAVPGAGQDGRAGVRCVYPAAGGRDPTR